MAHILHMSSHLRMMPSRFARRETLNLVERGLSGGTTIKMLLILRTTPTTLTIIPFWICLQVITRFITSNTRIHWRKETIQPRNLKRKRVKNYYINTSPSDAFHDHYLKGCFANHLRNSCEDLSIYGVTFAP